MKTKRILSMLLAVVMSFSILPTSAFANEDVYEVIKKGVGSSASYINEQLDEFHVNGGVTYGFEWYIITMLRAGKNIDENILSEYYESIEETIVTWTSETKPTDIERTALALSVMGKDITDVGGVNLAEMIYNSEKLSDGANELAYALLALDAKDTAIPETAAQNRDNFIEELLKFQLADGSFGLYGAETGDIDITAICLQALAPYRDNETVETAIDNALAFLRGVISPEYNFSDNPNSTAQVLLALSSLEIDVTDSENGFGDTASNLITALQSYKNPDGNGYLYEDSVNSMATVQIMQAYDAYRKAHKDNVSYWDFTESGENYDDTVTDDETEEDNKKADSAIVYVTIVSEGTVVSDKNDDYVAQAPVTVEDCDENGILTVDEALFAAHEEYYDGGAGAGYDSYVSTYGLSLATLWGKGNTTAPASAGYWLNNKSCLSLADEVKAGDYLTAFNYFDTIAWSDKYSYFAQNTAKVNSGKSVTLELKFSSYDENWNPVISPCADANVVFLESNDNAQDTLKTDEDGKVKIKFSSSLKSGDYYVMAYKDDNSIVPAVCKITVTASSSNRNASGSSVTTAYTVKFDTNGADEISSQKIYKNGYVSKPENPIKEGYIFDGWYQDQNFEIPYDFNMKVTKDFTIYAKWQELEIEEKTKFDENTFDDVTSSDWYYEAVKYVCENNIMQGTDNGFEPESNMTRAMLITVLYRMADIKEQKSTHHFKDVPADAWYSDAVSWAAENNIVNGISSEEFAPNSFVTREQMAAIFCRYAEFKWYDTESSTELSDFSDASEIADWAKEAVAWANSTELISGMNNNLLMPKSTATRAQTATIIMRFCKTFEELK